MEESKRQELNEFMTTEDGETMTLYTHTKSVEQLIEWIEQYKNEEVNKVMAKFVSKIDN